MKERKRNKQAERKRRKVERKKDTGTTECRKIVRRGVKEEGRKEDK